MMHDPINIRFTKSCVWLHFTDTRVSVAVHIRRAKCVSRIILSSVALPDLRHFRRVRKFAKSDYWLRHVRPSIRLSVRMKQLDSHWTDFHKIWCLEIFGKYLEKIQVSLKYDNANGYFTWMSMTTMTISRSLFVRIVNISDKSCIENQTHILCSITFFPPENHVVYEKTWKNIVQPYRTQMKI